MSAHRLMVLTGPTGVGKSGWGLELSQALGFEILSLDSMLVYRDMNIGTAKPSREDLQRVRHHLVDILDPAEEYDAARFSRDAQSIVQRQPPLLAVGGTPFYLKALMEGLPRRTSSRSIEDHLSEWSTVELRRWLERLDPVRAAAVHINDRFRSIRALGIILHGGRRASDPPQLELPTCSLKLLGLHMERPLLHKKLKERLDAMFEKGLLEEAHALWQRPSGLSRTARSAVGYRQLYAYFEGRSSLDEAREKILVQTRRLLKHQMTWLSKMPVEWVSLDHNSTKETAAVLRAKISQFYDLC